MATRNDSSGAELARVPLVVLGGSDCDPARLPREAGGGPALGGYKGAEIQVGGRTLMQAAVERFRSCGAFEPVYVAGPARLYGTWLAGEPGLRLIDTDGSLGENALRAIERVGCDLPGSPVAFAACDVLPAVDELRALWEHYARSRPCAMWYPLLRAPEQRAELRSSSWKPIYALFDDDGVRVQVLPPHLIAIEPDALRLDLMEALSNAVYATRNRSVRVRRNRLFLALIRGLLGDDLRRALSLRRPDTTLTVLRGGLRVARLLRRDALTRAVLERSATEVAVRTGYRRAHPERGVRVPILEGLTLAKDLDTDAEVEEARSAWADGA